MKAQEHSKCVILELLVHSIRVLLQIIDMISLQPFLGRGVPIIGLTKISAIDTVFFYQYRYCYRVA